MDALFRDYPSVDDDDDDDDHGQHARKRHRRALPPTPPSLPPPPRPPAVARASQPHSPDSPSALRVPILAHTERRSLAGVSGRYVSKRERAAMAASSLARPPSPPLPPPAELPSVLNVELPHHIQRKLDHAKENAGARNRCPQGRAIRLEGHSKPVIAVRWSPTHGALLASAGMDGKAYVWNAWGSPCNQMARCLNCHTEALKDLQWSLDGASVLSCGFDQTARLSDVETGKQTQVSF